MRAPLFRAIRSVLAAAAATVLGGAAGCRDGYDPPPPITVWCDAAVAAGESPLHLVVNVQVGSVVSVEDAPLPEGCGAERGDGGAVRYDAANERVVVTVEVVNRTSVPVSGLAVEVRFVGDDDGVPMHAPRVDSTASYVTPEGWRAFPVAPATLAPGESGTADVALKVPAAEYEGISASTRAATGGYRVEIVGGVVARPAAPPPAPAPYLMIEVEDAHPGPALSSGAVDGWLWAAAVNGSSGAGVVQSLGRATAPFCTTIAPPMAGDWRVWVRSGALGGSVEIDLGGTAVGVAAPSGVAAFSWSDLGTATLSAGPTTLCLTDDSDGDSQTDAIILTTDLAASPDALLHAFHQLGDPIDAHAAAVEAVAARVALSDALPPPATLADWLAVRDTLKAELLDGLGFDAEHPDPAVPPETVDVVDHGDYVVEKIRFYAHPDLPATGLLYIPAGPAAGAGPWPLVLSPIGHWGPGKAYEPEQLRNITLARLGYVAFSVDPLNQGERVAEGNDHFLALSHYLIGDQLAAVFLLEWMRALDWLVERAEVDPTRVAVSGASGGGTMSIFLGAIDDRITAVAPVVSTTSWENLMVDAARGDSEQYPFGTASLVPQWAILALSAPKPMLAIAAESDATFPPDQAEEVANAAAPVWDLYGTGTSLTFMRFPGPHGYDVARREAFYAWLDGVFQGDASPVVEPAADVDSSGALSVGLGASPTTALGRVAVEAAGLPAVAAPGSAADAMALADDVRATLEAAWAMVPAAGAAPAVTALGAGAADGLGAVRERMLIESEEPSATDGDGYAFEAELYRPAGWPGGAGARGPAVVYVSDGGKESAVHVPALLARGLAVLAIDARMTGAMLPGVYDLRISRMSAYAALGVGDSVAGWRLADVLAAVRALAARPDVDSARIAVVGGGNECAPVALAAAALDPLVAAAAADLPPGSIADMLRAEVMVPPGLVTDRLVLTVDIAEMAAAAAPKPVLVVRAHDPTGAPLDAAGLAADFAVATATYDALGAPDALALLAPTPPSPGAALADFLAAALAP